MQRAPDRRHRILALLAALSVAAGEARAESQPPPAAAPHEVRVALCQASADAEAWRGVIFPALARPLAAADVSTVRVRPGVDCQALRVETACVAGVYDAGGKGVACSPVSLVQLVRAAAWYALRRRPGERYEAFRTRQPAPINLAAIHFADGAEPDTTLETRLAGLPHADDFDRADESGRTFLITVGLVYAAVFGHEDGHLYEAAPYCGLASPSLAETGGLFAAVSRVQMSGELFKPADPSSDEVRADRCAGRRIREAIAAYARQEAAHPEDIAFARRAAADIIALALLIHDGTAAAKPDSTPIDGYFYPPLRMLLLAGELDADSRPRLCGAAAETFVQVTQLDFRAFSGNGILPDDLQTALPPGVPDAWNRKSAWSSASFACPGD